MRVLTVHNFYQEPGGEDQVFRDEAELLRRRGVEVQTFSVHNDRIQGMSQLTVAGQTLWGTQASDELADAAADFRPDVTHFHNTFPLISPTGYRAVRRLGSAVVQTLHNFRLICPNGTMFRNGGPCEDCLGAVAPWRAVAHACYRGDRKASAVAAGMLTLHQALGSYRRWVDRYIACSSVTRDKLVRGGLPASRVCVKPNFIFEDPGVGPGDGGYVLFLGRLTEEKGVRLLLDAWRRLDGRTRLVIHGDGPLRDEVRAAAAANPAIEWRGQADAKRKIDAMQNAAALAIPSLWYEGAAPKVLLEAFACGTPAIGFDHGTLPQAIEPGVNGDLVHDRTPESFAEALTTLLADPAGLAAMRPAARAAYERSMTPEPNYQQLMEIYRQAMSQRGAAAGPPRADVSLRSQTVG